MLKQTSKQAMEEEEEQEKCISEDLRKVDRNICVEKRIKQDKYRDKTKEMIMINPKANINDEAKNR